MSKSTMVELVMELEALNIRTPHVMHIIEEAKAGEYHDYKNQKYACGKVEVYNKLKFVGLDALAKRVMDGEFDEEPDEADRDELRRITPKNMWHVLGLGP